MMEASRKDMPEVLSMLTVSSHTWRAKLINQRNLYQPVWPSDSTHANQIVFGTKINFLTEPDV